MDNDKKTGIIVIAVLVVSLALVVYGAYAYDTEIYTINSLNADELNGTVENININIEGDVGSTVIVFEDSDNIYDINSSSEKSTDKVNLTYSQDANTLNVNVNSSNNNNIIKLSNKYHYNITSKCFCGALVYDISNDAKVDNINSTIGIGGCTVNLGGGVLSNFNSQITMGGLNIEGMPNTLTNINSTIALGGVNMVLNESVSNVHSSILFGGAQLDKVITDNATTDFKDVNYDTSVNKVNINSDIQVGGIRVENSLN